VTPGAAASVPQRQDAAVQGSVAAVDSADAESQWSDDEVFAFSSVRRLPSSLECEPVHVPPGREPRRAGPGARPSLDRTVIREVIRRHEPEVKACYEAVMVQTPSPQGRVVTRFIINDNGAVRHSCVKLSTLKQPNAERCIADHILTWEFPKPLGGGWVTVEYPFTLTPDPELQAPPSK
jgi:hypothetical protein